MYKLKSSPAISTYLTAPLVCRSRRGFGGVDGEHGRMETGKKLRQKVQRMADPAVRYYNNGCLNSREVCVSQGNQDRGIVKGI